MEAVVVIEVVVRLMVLVVLVVSAVNNNSSRSSRCLVGVFRWQHQLLRPIGKRSNKASLIALSNVQYE